MPTSDRRIYLNADKSKVVEGDSPEAAHLFAVEGDDVSDEDAKRYGLKFDTKAQKPAENKAEQPDADKSEDAPTDEPTRTRRAAS